jgi:hypothetical protein
MTLLHRVTYASLLISLSATFFCWVCASYHADIELICKHPVCYMYTYLLRFSFNTLILGYKIHWLHVLMFANKKLKIKIDQIKIITYVVYN